MEMNELKDVNSESSLSTMAEMISEAGDLLELTSTDEDNSSNISSSNSNVIKKENGLNKKVVPCDVSVYMSQRMMSPIQEKWNAWTVVPNVLYCMYFLLAGKWVSEQAIEMAQLDMMNDLGQVEGTVEGSFREWVSAVVDASDHYNLLSMFGLEGKCFFNSYFPNMQAIPPLPLLAIVLGTAIHAPFSFLYHYNCATILPPDISRIEHWSRRMDHSMIHAASAFLAYGTSGRWDYFIVNAVYNLDCIYRQFKPRVDPKLNKIRILISIIGYILPVLRRGNFSIFLQLCVVIAVSGWLFAKYPIKGWSHSAFHIVISMVPHLLLVFACTLPMCQYQINTAARCALISSN